MDKVATLKALQSTTGVGLLYHDLIDQIEYIRFRGASEPVLIFEMSEFVSLWAGFGWRGTTPSGAMAACSPAVVQRRSRWET